jgi:hypothetical protein
LTFPVNKQTKNWTVLPADWEKLRKRRQGKPRLHHLHPFANVNIETRAVGATARASVSFDNRDPSYFRVSCAPMNFWRALLIGMAISAVQVAALRGKGPSMAWAPVVLFGPVLTTIVGALVFLLRGQRDAALGLCIGPVLVTVGLFLYALSVVHV